MMTAIIWEHWYTYYVTFKDNSGSWLKTEHCNTLEEAKAEAKRWGAFISYDYDEAFGR